MSISLLIISRVRACDVLPMLYQLIIAVDDEALASDAHRNKSGVHRDVSTAVPQPTSAQNTTHDGLVVVVLLLCSTYMYL